MSELRSKVIQLYKHVSLNLYALHSPTLNHVQLHCTVNVWTAGVRGEFQGELELKLRKFHFYYSYSTSAATIPAWMGHKNFENKFTMHSWITRMSVIPKRSSLCWRRDDTWPRRWRRCILSRNTATSSSATVWMTKIKTNCGSAAECGKLKDWKWTRIWYSFLICMHTNKQTHTHTQKQTNTHTHTRIQTLTNYFECLVNV